MIPYGRQSVDSDDVAAVLEVLTSDFITQGPRIEQFEQALCDYTSARYAVAMSSGTAALHAAAHAAGLGPGDLVVTSPLSFVASANAARYVGAEVGFIDIDPDTLNADPERVPTGADAFVAVHFAGLPLDLGRLANRPRVVIEDAAHALGAHTPDGPVGNCAKSDMCCFSFHPVKSVTTGEGGAVTTNSPELAERLRRFRHHGIVVRPEISPVAYDVVEVGYNCRLTDIQAALGTSQMRKLDRFIDRRNRVAEMYRRKLGSVDGLRLPPEPGTGTRHAYHLFTVQVPGRDAMVTTLREHGVGVQVHYPSIQSFSAFSGSSAAWPCPSADEAYGRLMSIPIFPGIEDRQVDEVVTRLVDVVEEGVSVSGSGTAATSRHLDPGPPPI